MSTEIEAKFKTLMDKSSNHYRDPWMVEDFISPEEVKKCIKLFDKVPIQIESTHERATRKDHLMYHEKIKVTQDLFSSKIKELFPGENVVVDGGCHTTWHAPTAIHTDGYQINYRHIPDVTHIISSKEKIVNDRKILGYTVLLPLELDGPGGTAHTTVFHQRFHGANQEPGNIEEVDNITNYTNQPFDKSHPDYPLLDYHKDEWLHGFTILKTFPWKPGRAIIFHRGQYHAAGKFQGYNTKTHLLFFVNFLE
jgi:hypothetical protein